MELLSVKETAQRLDVHPFTLRRWEERGLLKPFQRVGERRVYLADDVERMAAERSGKLAGVAK